MTSNVIELCDVFERNFIIRPMIRDSLFYYRVNRIWALYNLTKLAGSVDSGELQGKRYWGFGADGRMGWPRGLLGQTDSTSPQDWLPCMPRHPGARRRAKDDPHVPPLATWGQFLDILTQWLALKRWSWGHQPPRKPPRCHVTAQRPIAAGKSRGRP